MEELKDDYREGESIVQYAIDTILLPFRIATSPLLLRTYLRTILLFLASTVLLAIAIIAYTSFYYSYIPIRGIRAPVYLQFHHGPATHPTVLQSHDVAAKNWPYGIANIPGLVSRQKYDVVVEMTVPRSTTNLQAGNWMIGLEMRGPSTVAAGLKGMLGWDEEWDVQDHSQGGMPGEATQKMEAGALVDAPTVLARSRRPAILTYRSYVIEHVHRLLRLPLYLVGWHTESEHVEVAMMEGVEFERGVKSVPTSVKVEIRAKYPLEVYTVAVRLSAKMEGLRWIMYRYWLSSAAAGVVLFWSVEMGVLLCTWAVFALLFGSPTTTPQKRIKQEDGNGTLKQEPRDDDATDPGTPYSDTSRTFPTLSTHQPLHYNSTSPTSPKSERDTPALEDIPMREDAEADDEEDDDFILEEPLPRSAERDGTFTDSGIGTSVESAVERERGLNRRRSGRRDDGR
ncbi:putative adipose-regulatory protein-domain-containing protein [Phaeosphaeria sp. MPI-PUGE-AT-0046c]|nr:putative adipose-regulatory protein-domain-containing protein [Phaeosphaeria sp. MPI-PUGE-AT-0046c]